MRVRDARGGVQRRAYEAKLVRVVGMSYVVGMQAGTFDTAARRFERGSDTVGI